MMIWIPWIPDDPGTSQLVSTFRACMTLVVLGLFARLLWADWRRRT